jgi:hypothetical protein
MNDSTPGSQVVTSGQTDRQTDVANLKGEISDVFIHNRPNTVSGCPEEPYECLET